MRILFLLILTLSVQSLYADASNELSKQVTIRRTAYGVPHILGETEKAAAFGFAWVQCEDHFPLVYKSIVRGRSEVSRWYGATDDNVEFDFQTRQLLARKTAVESYHYLPADYRDVLAGFSAGVNAYMTVHPEETLPWMTPVTPHDVSAAWEMAIMRFTFLRGNVLGRIKHKLLKPDVSWRNVSQPCVSAIGSNTIALAASRTTSGKAMLLNNPHQPWSEEANYYEAHVTVPEVYDFYGSTFVGCPILTTGFNRHLGWSHTVNHPDLFELYEVTLDPQAPQHYLFDSSSVPIETVEVTIRTDGDDTVSRTMSWSPLGPVVHKSSDKAYILRSSGFEQLRTGPQWYRMSKATNLTEFRAALAMQEIPMFNVAYADREGNIMYLWNGRVPKLPHKANRYKPVVAQTTDDIWTEIHPLEDLIQLVNPKGGYVQNCNSPPYLTNLHAPLNRLDYPRHFPNNDLSLRTQQCLNLIHNEQKFSLEEFANLKFDTKMLLAERIKPELIQILDRANLGREQQDAISMLKAWDNTANAESTGSVLFKLWWNIYRKKSRGFAKEWQEHKPMSTPTGIASPKHAVKAFQQAMDEAKQQWGSWSVSWGDVHRIRLGSVDLPVGGCDGRFGVLRVCEFKDSEDGLQEMNGGDGYVFVVEFGVTPRAYSVLAYGQSSRSNSKHRTDQARLFAKNKMKPVAFTESEIASQLLREYHPLD